MMMLIIRTIIRTYCRSIKSKHQIITVEASSKKAASSKEALSKEGTGNSSIKWWMLCRWILWWRSPIWICFTDALNEARSCMVFYAVQMIHLKLSKKMTKEYARNVALHWPVRPLEAGHYHYQRNKHTWTPSTTTKHYCCAKRTSLQMPVDQQEAGNRLVVFEITAYFFNIFTI